MPQERSSHRARAGVCTQRSGVFYRASNRALTGLNGSAWGAGHRASVACMGWEKEETERCTRWSGRLPCVLLTLTARLLLLATLYETAPLEPMQPPGEGSLSAQPLPYVFREASRSFRCLERDGIVAASPSAARTSSITRPMVLFVPRGPRSQPVVPRIHPSTATPAFVRGFCGS